VSEERERRLALNEALARDVNEVVEQVAGDWFGAGEPIEFRCECIDPGCSAAVRITRSEYLGVRESGRRFVVAPGHEDESVEVVVARVRGYPLVEKTGIGRTVAEETDPRG
jgi:hypothetical protein